MGAVTDTACNSQLEDSWYYLLGIAETTGYCRHSVMALSEPWYWICLPVDVLFCFGFFFTKIHTIFYCNDAIIQKWLPISFKINLDLKVKFKLVPFKISQRYFKYLELFMFYISNVTQNLTLYLIPVCAERWCHFASSHVAGAEYRKLFAQQSLEWPRWPRNWSWKSGGKFFFQNVWHLQMIAFCFWFSIFHSVTTFLGIEVICMSLQMHYFESVSVSKKKSNLTPYFGMNLFFQSCQRTGQTRRRLCWRGWCSTWSTWVWLWWASLKERTWPLLPFAELLPRWVSIPH